jgi:anthranilate phosphoribosyltransferase
MKPLLERLFAHQTLTRAEACAALESIGRGECGVAQMTAFVTVFLLRPVTVDELEGFREALLGLCQPVDLGGVAALDLCGTGGDGRHTFNISTLAALVVAACGVPVAKHGNYGVSSVSGSSNVLEYLGYRFTNDVDALRRELDRAGLCFLHAPLFHPAMKHVAPVRRELGVKTFFNMLGPLVNPAAPAYQCTGVFSLDLARRYNYLLQAGGRRFTVVYSTDGYDEISLTGPFKQYANGSEALIDPAADWGLPRLAPADLLAGETVADAAGVFVSVLEGRGTPAQNAVVTVNAAVALRCARPALSVSDSLEMAGEALRSGKAQRVLQTLLN